MKRSHVISVVATVLVSVGALVGVLVGGLSPLLGLDLRGGVSVVYKPARPVNTATLNETINIIRNRVDALGVAQPNIGTQGGNIVVDLPGVKNRAQALAVIGRTAQLYFRPVLCPVPMGPVAKVGQSAPVLSGLPPSCTSGANFAKLGNTPRRLDKASLPVLLPAVNPSTGKMDLRYVLGPSQLSGSALKTATASLNPQSGHWGIDFTLTSKGSPAFDNLARLDYQKQLAIVLDGVVESAPVINSTSFAGQGRISGHFSAQQAKSLALVLRYGALPVQLDQQTVQSVSPTLGAASLSAGIVAGLAGLALVMLYTIAYYRALGVVVVAGLATTAALLYSIISVLSRTNGLTLDLAGVTGLIVSVGVTVDSYVVYFERLKDEIRSGASIRASVDRGFARAFRTIVAADLVSLIGAAVLYLLSIAQVRGFAFFLGLSTLLDIATAWVFTRPLVILLGRSRTFREARWLGVARGLGMPVGGTGA